MTVHALHPCRPIRGPILSDSLLTTELLHTAAHCIHSFHTHERRLAREFAKNWPGVDVFAFSPSMGHVGGRLR